MLNPLDVDKRGVLLGYLAFLIMAKVLTDKQIRLIQSDIDEGIRELDGLFQPEVFQKMTKADKDNLFRRARKVMNRITDNSSLMINGIPLDSIYESKYDSQRKKLNDIGFRLSQLKKKTHPEVNDIKAQYFNSLYENQKAQEYTFKQKIEMMDEIMKGQVKGEVFKPRITLLEFNNQKFNTIAKKNGMKKSVKNTERMLQKKLQTSINEGWSYKKTFDESKKIVETVFPNGSVTSPRRKKDGTYTTWSQPIDKYTEDWMQSSVVQAQSKATVASMMKAGADIVQIEEEGSYTCPICKRIISQGKGGKGLYSITGKTPGYPKLVAASPFHTKCDCSTDVAGKEHQQPLPEEGVERAKAKAEKEIVSKEKQVQQQKKIVNQIDKQKEAIKPTPKVHKQFKDIDEVLGYTSEADKTFVGWRKKLSEAQRESLLEYKEYTYTDLNKYLRTGKVPKGSEFDEMDLVENYNLIKKSISKPLPENTIVYRGFSDPDIAKTIKNGNIENLVGMEYKDNAFMSTTLDNNISELFIKEAHNKKELPIEAVIKLPKGHKVALIQDVEDMDNKITRDGFNESELLLEDSLKYQITSAIKTKKEIGGAIVDYYRIELEVLKNG